MAVTEDVADVPQVVVRPVVLPTPEHVLPPTIDVHAVPTAVASFATRPSWPTLRPLQHLPDHAVGYVSTHVMWTITYIPYLAGPDWTSGRRCRTR
eukprot:4692550-Pyramimonas_sp.AAC.1